MTDSKGRVFSGARPTGRQHLGNYLGAIRNYVALQDDYDCVYCIVDLHALTTLEDTSKLRAWTYEMALDWLAAGIDPEERDTILFVQSHVPQVTELHTLLSMVTPLGRLTRLPTFKEKVRQQPENVNYGLVGYPVLMAADINPLQGRHGARRRRSSAPPGVHAGYRPPLQPPLRRRADRAAGQVHRHSQGTGARR